MMENLTLSDVRDWLFLFFVVGGALISWKTYNVSIRQRRFENSFKILELFYNNLKPNDIDNWKNVFKGSDECTGAEFGKFYFGGNLYHFSELFNETSPDNGAIRRIVDKIELICQEVELETVELRIIYSDIGQMMLHLIKYVESDELLSCFYPSFISAMNENKSKLERFRIRVISLNK